MHPGICSRRDMTHGASRGLGAGTGNTRGLAVEGGTHAPSTNYLSDAQNNTEDSCSRRVGSRAATFTKSHRIVFSSTLLVAAMQASGKERAMEWASGWSKIAVATARERPGAALAVVAAVGAALPFLLCALALAALTFLGLALPLSFATAAWWVVTNRDSEKKQDGPSTILSRLRAGTLRLSTLSEGSERVCSEISNRGSSIAEISNKTVDLLVVYSGQADFKMEGGDDAARLVARRIADIVERPSVCHTHGDDDSNNTPCTPPRTVCAVDVETLCDVETHFPGGPSLEKMLADGCANVLFVVESSVCLESPSDALRKFKRKLKALSFANTDRTACAPFTTVAVSRSVGPDGSVWCGPKVGGKAGAEFDREIDELFCDKTTRLCPRCDAEIEHNGPGVVDRWAREVLVPALGGFAPLTPRILSLSSTHTALLTRHLGARDSVVGCDSWFHDTEHGVGDVSVTKIPRIDPWAPDLELVKQLNPTLIVCAYDASAEALREIAPRWRLGDSFAKRESVCEGEGDSSSFSFEIVTLPCPLGRDCLRKSAAQILTLGGLARVDENVAQQASDKLTDGLLEIRAKAEKAFGGDRGSIRNDNHENPKTKTLRPQPWIFIEADPELFSADSCTPLGAALAEGLGVGNIADPVWSDETLSSTDDASLSSRAAAALALRMKIPNEEKSAPKDTHYPQLSASRFWSPREPDWWVVAHPTDSGSSATEKSFGDSLDPEDRERHAALREKRVVALSNHLCHAASQWTPELVDVVAAVFEEMAKRVDEIEVVVEEEEAIVEVQEDTEAKEVQETQEANDVNAFRDADGTSFDSAMEPTSAQTKREVLHDSLRDRNLRGLPKSFLTTDLPVLGITHLDLSKNELSELPGLGSLANSLKVLKLERNWFEKVPPEVGTLPFLEELDLSRNFVRPSDASLALDSLSKLKHLKVVDLRWNRKVCTAEVLARMRRRLSGGPVEESDSNACESDGISSVDVRVTVSFPAPDGAFVGSSPADRNANLLRAQLEPWSTLQLRRRLIEDFHQDQAAVGDPERVLRAEVMSLLLRRYETEGLLTPKGIAQRPQRRVVGTPVPELHLAPLRVELKAWLEQRAKGAKGNVQERPSIDAEAYMILRSPTDFNAKLGAGSRAARKAADKFAKFECLWKCAEIALRGVDSAFANEFTALAVTYQFQGSPHIDKQNVGPFYGLAIGDFADGTGGICVESTARTVLAVNTKHALGKIDGRFPHWVAPWDVENSTRFSLIYYRTTGDPEPITAAAFDGDGIGVGGDSERESSPEDEE